MLNLQGVLLDEGIDHGEGSLMLDHDGHVLRVLRLGALELKLVDGLLLVNIVGVVGGRY